MFSLTIQMCFFRQQNVEFSILIHFATLCLLVGVFIPWYLKSLLSCGFVKSFFKSLLCSKGFSCLIVGPSVLLQNFFWVLEVLEQLSIDNIVYCSYKSEWESSMVIYSWVGLHFNKIFYYGIPLLTLGGRALLNTSFVNLRDDLLHVIFFFDHNASSIVSLWHLSLWLGYILETLY